MSRNFATILLASLGLAFAACGGSSQEPLQGFTLATLSSADITPPTAPANLVWTNVGMTVTMSWGASTDDVGVETYDFYYGSYFIGSTTDTLATLIGFQPSTPYNFTVKARDAAGNVSAASSQITVLLGPPQDTIPPTAPTNLRATNVTTSSVTLSWTASIDNVGVVVYQISQGNAAVATAFGSTSATVSGLAANTTYGFTVRALDAANNVSPASTLLWVSTAAPIDTTPPSAPTNLVSSNVTSSSVTLSWTASTDNVGVAGYNVYQGSTLVASPSATSAAVSGLSAHTTYSFTVRARDSAGNLSAAGNAASVTTASSTGPFTLAWQDDFNAFDSSRWQLMTHTWDGNLAQFSTANTRFSSGILSLLLTSQPSDSAKPFRGVEMRSLSTITYGKIETRARYARGSGVVSATVLIYTPWPADNWNELDMKYLGYNSNSIQFNEMVYLGTPPTPPVTTSVTPTQYPQVTSLGFDASADFHVYSVEWTPQAATFLVDGVVKHSWSQEIGRMKLPQNILLTIWASSSSSWAGPIQSNTAPTQADFDWIKVYNYTP